MQIWIFVYLKSIMEEKSCQKPWGCQFTSFIMWRCWPKPKLWLPLGRCFDTTSHSEWYSTKLYGNIFGSGSIFWTRNKKYSRICQIHSIQCCGKSETLILGWRFVCLIKCFGEMLQNFTRFLEYKKETLNIYLFLFIMINLVNFDKHFIKHNLEGRTKIRKKIA